MMTTAILTKFLQNQMKRKSQLTMIHPLKKVMMTNLRTKMILPHNISYKKVLIAWIVTDPVHSWSNVHQPVIVLQRFIRRMRQRQTIRDAVQYHASSPTSQARVRLLGELINSERRYVTKLQIMCNSMIPRLTQVNGFDMSIFGEMHKIEYVTFCTCFMTSMVQVSSSRNIGSPAQAAGKSMAANACGRLVLLPATAKASAICAVCSWVSGCYVTIGQANEQ